MLRRSLFTHAKLAPDTFFKSLEANKHKAFFGVPDSLLKDLCAYITDNVSTHRHVITANEGNAVAMASGFHMSTGEVPVVYLQNSGWGNTLNPLLSLTHAEVCKVPMLMLVGWRGDPTGKKDEPQHVAQGRLMAENLAAAEVPFSVLEPSETVEADAQRALQTAADHFETYGTPYALLIKRDTFSKYSLKNKPTVHVDNLNRLPMTREQAIDTLLGSLDGHDLIVGTTGMPSREVFECRVKRGEGHERDFLTVGCMGHASSIAAGVCLGLPEGDKRDVVVVDGDGAALMHLGAMPVNAGLGAVGHLKNLKHVVLNNAAHDSVGGQPTVGMSMDLTKVAQSVGYKTVRSAAVETQEDLVEAVKELKAVDGPAFLEVHVQIGNRPDLGRPTRTPQDNKAAFSKSLVPQ